MGEQPDYRIESLCHIFAKQADELQVSYDALIAHYAKNKPNEPLPDCIKDDFNQSRALEVMAKEIQLLKMRCN